MYNVDNSEFLLHFDPENGLAQFFEGCIIISNAPMNVLKNEKNMHHFLEAMQF